MRKKRFVICIDNSGYEASLELRKIYESLADPEAEKLAQLRVIDESGEDYLYAASRFLNLPVTRSMEAALTRAA